MAQRLNAAKVLALPRYEACVTLYQNDIAYVVWFEDALWYYQVPTAAFHLYLLVLDLDRATDVLVSSGWTLDTLSRSKIAHIDVSTAQHRLSLPQPQAEMPIEIHTTPPSSMPQAPVHDRIVLLLATDWYFDLASNSTATIVSSIHLPRLPILLDCLIEALLEEDSDKAPIQGYIACQVAYLYEHNSKVKSKGFGSRLRHEHRQFHFDTVAGLPTVTRPGIRHEQSVRDALLEGSRTLCDLSITEEELMRGLPPKPKLPSSYTEPMPLDHQDWDSL